MPIGQREQEEIRLGLASSSRIRFDEKFLFAITIQVQQFDVLNCRMMSAVEKHMLLIHEAVSPLSDVVHSRKAGACSRWVCIDKFVLRD